MIDEMKFQVKVLYDIADKIKGLKLTFVEDLITEIDDIEMELINTASFLEKEIEDLEQENEE